MKPIDIHRRNLRGGALPTVLIVSVMMLLILSATFIMFNANNILRNYIKRQWNQFENIESGYILYCNDFPLHHEDDNTASIKLYDNKEKSYIKICSEMWGLYEKITISGAHSIISSTRLIGMKQAFKEPCSLYYSNGKNNLSITGRTYIEGMVYASRKGIMDRQIQWEFFSGKRLDKDSIVDCTDTIPAPNARSEKYIQELFDSSTNTLTLLRGDKIYINRETPIKDDYIVVGNSIIVEDGCKMSAQLFAKDSIIIGKDVVMEYPSGIYVHKGNPLRYMEIQEGSIINGYAIVNGTTDSGTYNTNFKQFPRSVVRGMVYVNGMAEPHGIINGVAFFNDCITRTGKEHYNHTLYDFTLLVNDDIAYPIWLETLPHKKVIKWIK